MFSCNAPLPRPTLFVPDVFSLKEKFWPTAVLFEAVLSSKDDCPTATLAVPVTFAVKALSPTATFCVAVVFNFKADFPIATLMNYL